MRGAASRGAASPDRVSSVGRADAQTPPSSHPTECFHPTVFFYPTLPRLSACLSEVSYLFVPAATAVDPAPVLLLFSRRRPVLILFHFFFFVPPQEITAKQKRLPLLQLVEPDFKYERAILEKDACKSSASIPLLVPTLLKNTVCSKPAHFLKKKREKWTIMLQFSGGVVFFFALRGRACIFKEEGKAPPRVKTARRRSAGRCGSCAAPSAAANE